MKIHLNAKTLATALSAVVGVFVAFHVLSADQATAVCASIGAIAAVLIPTEASK